MAKNVEKPEENDRSEKGEKSVTVRVPIELFNELDARAKAHGMTRTELLLQALRTDLDALARDVLRGKLEELEKRLNAGKKAEPKPPKKEGQ